MFKKRKKDTRTYKNFKYWSIDKLESVLNENYCRGVNGHDYDHCQEEMKQVLWNKQNKFYLEQMEREIEERG